MNATIPPEIQTQLDDFLTQVNTTLPGLLNGFYLYGSIALEAFHPQKSDIDFLAIINRPCTETDIRQLADIHQIIATHYPVNPMAGCYVQKTVTGTIPVEVDTCPSYFDGAMHPLEPHDINLVTWWILKNHGITLQGIDIQSFAPDVKWEVLIRAMRENLNSYWHAWAHHPKRALFLLSDWGIEWSVLGVLRLYYSFREAGVTSKSGAGEYALLQLPEQWHPLIQHALVLRNERVTSYKNRLTRQQDTRQFLRFVIAKCNEMFE